MSKTPEGFTRTEDGYLVFRGGRHYDEPGEAIKTWHAGQLRPGCNAYVFETWSSHPCGRTPKHDPDANGRPTKCGLHSQAAIAKRKAKQQQSYNKWMMRSEAETALREAQRALEASLRQIAAGHNDPRSLAQDALDALDNCRAAVAASKS